MKAKIKRNQRAYRIADKPYNKAMKRAAKEKTTVANLVENIITAYADGCDTVTLKTQQP
jgi:hypothetical protein